MGFRHLRPTPHRPHHRHRPRHLAPRRDDRARRSSAPDPAPTSPPRSPATAPPCRPAPPRRWLRQEPPVPAVTSQAPTPIPRSSPRPRSGCAASTPIRPPASCVAMDSQARFFRGALRRFLVVRDDVRRAVVRRDHPPRRPRRPRGRTAVSTSARTATGSASSATTPRTAPAGALSPAGRASGGTGQEGSSGRDPRDPDRRTLRLPEPPPLPRHRDLRAGCGAAPEVRRWREVPFSLGRVPWLRVAALSDGRGSR